MTAVTQATHERRGYIVQEFKNQDTCDGADAILLGMLCKQICLATAGKLPEAFSAPDLPLGLGTHRGLATQDLVLEALSKAGGNDGHVHFAFVGVVDDGSEDHVGARVGQRGDHLRYTVYFLQGQVPAARDVVNDPGGPLDRSLD